MDIYIKRYVSVPPQLDKARRAYHKVSRKEQVAREREAHAQGNPDVAIDKQKKIQEERELAQLESEKVPGPFMVGSGSGGLTVTSLVSECDHQCVEM